MADSAITFPNQTSTLADTTAAQTWTAVQNFSPGVAINAGNIATDATTGLKIGTATTQKIGVFNATPVTQQSATIDPAVALSNLGWRASGTAYPITTSGTVSTTGSLTNNNSVGFSGSTTMSGAVAMTASVRSNLATITAATTLTTVSTEYQICNPTAAITVTLPTTTTPGYRFTIKNISSFAVTVAGTIDGATNYSLASINKYVTLISTATSGTWYIVGNN